MYQPTFDSFEIQPFDYIECTVIFSPYDARTLPKFFEEMFIDRLQRNGISDIPRVNGGVFSFSIRPESLSSQWFSDVQGAARSIFREYIHFKVLLIFENEVIQRIDEGNMKLLEERLHNDLLGITEVAFDEKSITLFISVPSFEKNLGNPVITALRIIRDEFLADLEPERFAEYSRQRVGLSNQVG